MGSKRNKRRHQTHENPSPRTEPEAAPTPTSTPVVVVPAIPAPVLAVVEPAKPVEPKPESGSIGPQGPAPEKAPTVEPPKRSSIESHFKTKFFAGALTAMPVLALVQIAVLVESQTAGITEHFGIKFPGMGLVMALAVVYLFGLVITNVAGTRIMKMADNTLRKIPGLKMLYTTGLDVLQMPPATGGTHAKVVLVENSDGFGSMLMGFTSGIPVDPAGAMLLIYFPYAPNPMNGQMIFVLRSRCRLCDVTVDEAFKFLMSNGNFIPPGLLLQLPAKPLWTAA